MKDVALITGATSGLGIKIGSTYNLNTPYSVYT